MKLDLKDNIFINTLISGAPANNPGAEWSAETIQIIKEKIQATFLRKKLVTGKFSLKSGDPDYNKYVFDPELKTVKVPYEKCSEEAIANGKCDKAYSDMDEKLQISPEKLLRLAFHDCIPYVNDDGSIEGGCDGCLNMEEDLKVCMKGSLG